MWSPAPIPGPAPNSWTRSPEPRDGLTVGRTFGSLLGAACLHRKGWAVGRAQITPSTAARLLSALQSRSVFFLLSISEAPDLSHLCASAAQHRAGAHHPGRAKQRCPRGAGTKEERARGGGRDGAVRRGLGAWDGRRVSESGLWGAGRCASSFTHSVPNLSPCGRACGMKKPSPGLARRPGTGPSPAPASS